MDIMDGYRFPRVLICGSDTIDADTAIPLWEQIAITLAKTYPQELEIDVVAHLMPNRDITSIKARLNQISEHINCDGVTAASNSRQDHLLHPEPHHTHVVYCGIEPPRAIQPTIAAVYVPTPADPAHPQFHFDRLGNRGFIVLREPEARKLLDDMDPERASGSALATIRARALARALAAQSVLDVLQGVVIARGDHGLDGCVSSAKVLVPRPFGGDEEDSDEDSDGTEERYEFDIPKPIIETSEVEPRGAYAVFVGKLVGSLVLNSASIPPIRVHTESQFSFQLEMACVAAATTALTLPAANASPADLAARIPTLLQLRPNISQYIHGRRMLLPGEEQPPKGDRPVHVRMSWPAPSASSHASTVVAAISRGSGAALRGLTSRGRGRGV